MRFFVLTNERFANMAIEAIQQTMKRHGLFSVEIKPYSPKRSNAQNNLFHMWIYEIAESFGVDTRNEYHMRALKDAIKNALRTPIESVDPFTGEIRMVPISTSLFNRHEMMDFLNDMERWAFHEHNIKLSQPQEYQLAINNTKEQLQREVDNGKRGRQV